MGGGGGGSNFSFDRDCWWAQVFFGVGPGNENNADVDST